MSKPSIDRGRGEGVLPEDICPHTGGGGLSYYTCLAPALLSIDLLYHSLFYREREEWGWSSMRMELSLPVGRSPRHGV